VTIGNSDVTDVYLGCGYGCSGVANAAIHATNLGTWGALNYPTWASGTPFVKMTAAGTFSLDTNTYLTSLSGAVVTDPTGTQTITQPVNTSLNVVTSGTGALESNGVPVLTTTGASGIYLPLVGGTLTGELNGPEINGVSSISVPSSIASVFAACPATGCTALLTQDITISSPVAVIIPNGKMFTFDLGSHTIHCAVASGNCLNFTGPLFPTNLKITNGTIEGSSSGESVTGLMLDGATGGGGTDYSLDNLSIVNFTASGATCVILNDIEDGSFMTVNLAGCYNGLNIGNQSNNLYFAGLHIIQGGAGVPLSIASSQNINFVGSLIQNNTHSL
jgi:hypothetical protein